MQSDDSHFSVLSIKPGHDGGVAYISDGRLTLALEAEKDNKVRYCAASAGTLLRALRRLDRPPSVIAYSGWAHGHPRGVPIAGGYVGLRTGLEEPMNLMGQPLRMFSSSHERSHILCAYGMSPFKQGQPCYALVWEGHIGSFYLVDDRVEIIKLGDILVDPGVRYAFLYALADPSFDARGDTTRLGDAGKLMAIAGYAKAERLSQEGRDLIGAILRGDVAGDALYKKNFSSSRYCNIGVTDPNFASVAKHLSDRIYDTFERAAARMVNDKLPLLISGGCGLNCEWNSRWIESGIFSDVFVPPCANDSGSAIGTAIDAMLYYTGRAKIDWDVYCGEEPACDVAHCESFTSRPLEAHDVARVLAGGAVLGWMSGRYEMGPRALGARSILASPCEPAMLERLNALKRREGFRPIAPVCLEEEMKHHFSPDTPSPYMLQFRKVISRTIPAVTHVDGSARPQSVNAQQNPRLYEVLAAFRQLTGVGVLCNTSLNYNGRGFLNKLSDLHAFAQSRGLDGFVFEDRLFMRT